MFYEKKFKIKGVTKRFPLPPFKEIQLELPIQVPESYLRDDEVDPETTLKRDGEVVINMSFAESDVNTFSIDFKDTYSW